MVKLFQDSLEIVAFYLVFVPLYWNRAFALFYEDVVISVYPSEYPASFFGIIAYFFKLHRLKYNKFIYLSINKFSYTSVFLGASLYKTEMQAEKSLVKENFMRRCNAILRGTFCVILRGEASKDPDQRPKPTTQNVIAIQKTGLSTEG